jgi:membrane protein DedA with SNARE-associated domain
VNDDPFDAFGLGSLSLAAALIVLFLFALARSHATYWAGRGVVRGAQTVHETDRGFAWWRNMITHLEAWTNTKAAQRGLDLVRGWGPIAVSFAFLTFGLQIAIFASAGLIGMRYAKFTIASIPGAIAWAIVWASVGLGAIWGAIKLFAASPILFTIVVGLIALLIAWWIRRRLIRRAARRSPGAHAEELDVPTDHVGRHVQDAENGDDAQS